MSAKKGIREHGYKAIETILTELTQLNNEKVVENINPNNLSSEEREIPLQYITLVTENHCGRIKGRTCADGWKQREYISK